MSVKEQSNTAPLISVVMAIYNEPVEWMRQSMESILNQTFRDFEFIIINDNPERVENRDILKEYSSRDSRIVVITNEVNIGLTKSLNKGLGVAKGEFIARMDADDISMPQRFEKQVRVFDNNKEIGVCGTAVEFFGDKRGVLIYPKTNDSIFLFLDNCFAHPTVMMRKCVADMRYDENCRCSQDYELWCRAFSSGVNFYNIQEPLLLYRHSRQQISSSRRREQGEIAQKIRREAYDYFSKENEIGLVMTGTPFSLDSITLFLTQTKLPQQEYSQFVYFLLLSSEECSSSLFRYILRYKLYKHISFMNIIRVLYHSLKGHDNKKY